jgi:hypothetical protein
MTSTEALAVKFSPPPEPPVAQHHAIAAAANNEVATEAILALSGALSRSNGYEKILLRAAAGAGKSVQLRRMVVDALAHPACVRVAVTAFMNRQIWPLAQRLGEQLGSAQVCLLSGKDAYGDVPDEVKAAATVVKKTSEVPEESMVVLATASKLGAIGEYGRQLNQLGTAGNEETPYDVLFVDEAWQMALHLFAGVRRYAPLTVGVGDVGQLPPIDATANPWRGDPGYNPYRAWPTTFEDKETTFSIDLPTVWRPHGNQLELWRAFYRDWEQLDCVAAPEDRTIELPSLDGSAADVWSAVATGWPTLLEVGGLEDPEAPDIDEPLLRVVEDLLDPLLAGGFVVVEREYDDSGEPADEAVSVHSSQPLGDPLIVILASRNAAVDQAHELVDRLTQRYGLPDGLIAASTVDKWQGQTNRITIGIHPLSGADELDDFNSAFGRLAVTCTRATHGLLLVTRDGIEDLLADAPARPGTPLGEPGMRTLPRQTHQRILGAFVRDVLRLSE